MEFLCLLPARGAGRLDHMGRVADLGIYGCPHKVLRIFLKMVTDFFFKLGIFYKLPPKIFKINLIFYNFPFQVLLKFFFFLGNERLEQYPFR